MGTETFRHLPVSSVTNSSVKNSPKRVKNSISHKIPRTIQAHRHADVNRVIPTSPSRLCQELNELYRHIDTQMGEGGGWFRPPHAGLKPHGTRGAIPLSNHFDAGDPKWDCTRLLVLPWFLYCLKRGGKLVETRFFPQIFRFCSDVRKLLGPGLFLTK